MSSTKQAWDAEHADTRQPARPDHSSDLSIHLPCAAEAVVQVCSPLGPYVDVVGVKGGSPEKAAQPIHLPQRQVVLAADKKISNAHQTPVGMQPGDSVLDGDVKGRNHCRQAYCPHEAIGSALQELVVSSRRACTLLHHYRAIKQQHAGRVGTSALFPAKRFTRVSMICTNQIGAACKPGAACKWLHGQCCSASAGQVSVCHHVQQCCVPRASSALERE